MVREIAELVSAFDLGDLSASAAQRLNLTLAGQPERGRGRRAVLRVCGTGAGRRLSLFSGGTAPNPSAAAFWNAAVMHARTQDDFHPVGNIHIGTVVIPALLAVADEITVSGREFLSALAAGYMVAVGISRASSPLTSPKGLRSTSLYGPFGVAAAVGKLRGASTEQIAGALGLATAFASGTTQTWIDGSDEWQLHVALCAEAGLRAVDLAMAGVVGGSQALSGSAGFFNAFTGRRQAFSDIAADFEPSSAIGECVIKRYRGERHLSVGGARGGARGGAAAARGGYQKGQGRHERVRTGLSRHFQPGTLSFVQFQAHERGFLLRIRAGRPPFQLRAISRAAPRHLWKRCSTR